MCGNFAHAHIKFAAEIKIFKIFLVMAEKDFKKISDFTNLYKVSKTLRFELKPVGNTKDRITEFIERDEKRAEAYVIMKRIIDNYFKEHIEQKLSGSDVKLKETDLLGLKCAIEKKEVEKQMDFQSNLRSQIEEIIKISDFLNDKFFSKKLPELYKDKTLADLFIEVKDDDKNRYASEIIDQFTKYATYFSGFKDNRKNVFTQQDISTSIPYRCIHDNFPKYVKNINVLNILLSSPIAEKVKSVTKSLGMKYPIEKLLDVNHFSQCLSQKQISEYNAIIGGIKTDCEDIDGINEYVNRHNQTCAKSEKLPFMTILFKQILSDRETKSWIPEQFENDSILLESVYTFLESKRHDLDCIKNLFVNIYSFAPESIFIAKSQLDNVSHHVFNQWNIISEALRIGNDEGVLKAKKEDESYNIKKLNDKLANYNKDLDNKISTDLRDYFKSLGEKKKITEDGKVIKKNVFTLFDESYSDVMPLLTQKMAGDKPLNQNEIATAKIKNVLDAMLDILHFSELLYGNGNETGRNIEFYRELERCVNSLKELIPLYNKVRNFVTTKSYSDSKFQLNFDKPDLLNGWVNSITAKTYKGVQYGGYLLRKRNEIGEYDYFLGISSDSKIFKSDKVDSGAKFEYLNFYKAKAETCYGKSYPGSYKNDKIAFYQIIQKFLNNICQSDKDKILKQFKILNKESIKVTTAQDPSIVKIYEWICKPENCSEETIKKLNSFPEFVQWNQKVIDNLVSVIQSAISVHESKELASRGYHLFTEAMKAIDELCNCRTFEYLPVSDSLMENVRNREKRPLLLFRIANKDLNFAQEFARKKRKSRGKDNLHTLIFKTLMQNDINKVTTFELANAQVFYRKQSLGKQGEKPRATHPANQPVKNKTNEETRVFPYDLVKDKRYTCDKIMLHLSISVNPNADKVNSVNNFVNTYIRQNIKDMCIIGIDRGERNLLYASVIDMHGNIKEKCQINFNVIKNNYNGVEYSTDYHAKLDKIEKERTRQRQNWLTISNIKNVKSGYLSQVVHRIVQLMRKYNAIVVLEDLNGGFKNSRKKIEMAVYQEFEKALIEKLNCLIFKDELPENAGGVNNPLQLTSGFTTFKEMTKQNGFLFYIPAWNTSHIDPATGFVNLFDTRYSNVKNAKEFFEKFGDIRFNHERDYFEFVVDDLTKFSAKAVGTQTKWTICTYGERITNKRNNNGVWESITVDVTSEMKSLFQNHGIDVNCNLKSAIKEQKEKSFFEPLLNLFRLTVQLRNSKTGTDVDYILSPVADENGNFFDSRNGDPTMPIDADANGAYNIARKGLWVIQQICEAKDLSKVKLAMDNKTWLEFAQQKPYKADDYLRTDD